MAYHFDNITLEKGMYQHAGQTFSQVLEKADPSENYKNTPYEGMDAFQRQLKRFDIHVKGANSDTVEKFFRTSQSAVLFPEFVSRAVRAGMEEENLIPAITASITRINGMDHRSLYTDDKADTKALRIVNEGTAIPTTRFKLQENRVKLKKHGRMLVASYEAIRFQRIDLFSVLLRRIGTHIMRSQLEDAIDVIINGDGNFNNAQKWTLGTDITGTKGKLSYDGLIQFWSKFDPYNMNTILVSPSVMLQLLRLPEFQNPLTGLNFQGTGVLTNPLGAKLIKTSAMPEDTIIGLDRNYALEMVQADDLSVEYDRLIDRQLERAAITSIAGFSKLYRPASQVMSI